MRQKTFFVFINNFLIYASFVLVFGVFAFGYIIIMAKIERQYENSWKNKIFLILTEYDIPCDLFDICRHFSSIPEQVVKELQRANKCPPRLWINNRLLNWFWY